MGSREVGRALRTERGGRCDEASAREISEIDYCPHTFLLIAKRGDVACFSVDEAIELRRVRHVPLLYASQPQASG